MRTALSMLLILNLVHIVSSISACFFSIWGETTKGRFNRDGASSVAMVTEAVHYTMAAPSRCSTTPVCVASAGLGTKRPASATFWPTGTVGQKLAPGTAATRDGGLVAKGPVFFCFPPRDAQPLCSLSLS